MKDRMKRLEESFTKKVVEYSKDNNKETIKKSFGNMFFECIDDIKRYVSLSKPILTYVAYRYFEDFDVLYSIDFSEVFSSVIDNNIRWNDRPFNHHVALRSSMLPEGYVFDLQDLCLINVPNEEIKQIEGLPMFKTKQYREIREYDYKVLIRDLHNIFKIVINDMKPFMKDPHICKIMNGENIDKIYDEKYKELNRIKEETDDLFQVKQNIIALNNRKRLR